MAKVYELRPYEAIGDLSFGMSRSEVNTLLGECRSTCMYGFPTQDRVMDNYGDKHALFSNKGRLEAVEILPMLLEEDSFIMYHGT